MRLNGRDFAYERRPIAITCEVVFREISVVEFREICLLQRNITSV